MDAMDNETRRRLEEEIIELQAQHEEALKTTFLSQKERDREQNRIKTAIRHRRKEITHPGLATKQKRERRQQIREQRVMEENTRNHAHRGLDSLASSEALVPVIPNALLQVRPTDNGTFQVTTQEFQALLQSLSIAGKEGGAAPTINVAQTMSNNFGVQNKSTDGAGTPEWAKRQGREQPFQGGLVRELHEASTTNKKAPPTRCASRYTAPCNPEDQTTAFESNSLSPEREPSVHDFSILEPMIDIALNALNLKTNIKYYTTHDPDPNDQLEVAYVARLSKVRGMMCAMEADGNFLAKQLAGLSQCKMDIDKIVSKCSKSWDMLANRLSRALYFFCNNQVIVYNEDALLQKEKHKLHSLVLPIAGFAHHTNVHVNNDLNTQLTISWFDNSSKDAARVLFVLIQLALASQCDDIHKGSQTPCLVQVEVPAEGNEPAAIVLSPDQFPQLTKLSGCDASEHSIEFKKTVFTAQQQAGLVKTAGQITLTNCVLIDNGQEISQLLKMGVNDVVLRQLKLYENFPFGTDQALKLVEACNKTVVIGSGTAANLFKQEHLVARLKEKAANGGLYHSVKFDFGSFSSSEKEAFHHFLAGTYTQKLGLSGDHATFAATKAEVIQQLLKAYDQDNPDDETYDWPFPNVDILHCSQYQAHLASYVKEKIEPLAFVEPQPPASYPSSAASRVAKYQPPAPCATKPRARVCACLRGLFSSFSGDFDIMNVRRLLGLTSPAGCAQLSQGQCLGTLHILHIYKYVSNRTFMDFWVLQPPEGCCDVASWQELYGRYPQVKTCKESLAILQKRIANYLEMPDPHPLPILSPHMSQEEAAEAFVFLTQFTGIGAVGRNTAHNASGETADDAGQTKTADDDDDDDNNINDGSEPGDDAGSN